MEQQLVERVTETNPGGPGPVVNRAERPATMQADRPAAARRRGAPSPDRGRGSSVTVVTPRRGWFDWRLGELWRYRDLITLFVWRDFVSLYKQTVLGPVWHILQPLLTTLTFTVVFGGVAGLSTEGLPPFLFYMAGIIGWNYFATCLTNTSRTLIAHAPMLGKVYFHRLVIPLSIVLSNLIGFAIQLAILLVAMATYAATGTTLTFSGWTVAVPFMVLLLAGYALGGGIIVSGLTTKYRDLAHLVTFGIQLMMFVTPVIYPLSGVSARYRALLLLNPLTPLIEGLRKGFLGVGSVTVEQVAVSGAVMLVTLVAGVALFSRVERTFMDTV